MNRGGGGGSRVLGIVIPAWNEAERLPGLLADLALLPCPHRVVVVDGGSSDGTPELAAGAGAQVVLAPRGRGRQLNAGARAAGTPWLLFLHADVRLPPATRTALVDWLKDADTATFGTFAFALEGTHWFWRFLELGQRLRERVAGLAYGDQGLLVSREMFLKVGGYPEIPLMEDLEILRLRRMGRWKKLDTPLLSSPRRYQEGGRWRGWIRNSILVSLYLLGVSPRRLARFYPPRRGEPPSSNGSPSGRRTPILLVFAKNPEPGRVKTRLAAEVGDEEAARIYRTLGRRVVGQLRGGSYRLVVVYDPPEAEQPVALWLGARGLELWPQAPGTLGERLRDAFQEGFRKGDRVVAVGTDAPEVDRALVEEAISRLESADVVLGPAADGGYYLLGLRGPLPDLFRDIPWSTSEVLEATRARARELGLVEAILPTLVDVDTLADWERVQAARSGSTE